MGRGDFARHARRMALCAFVLLSTLAAGCADLQAVRDFGQLSARIAAEPQITTDYLATGARMALLLDPADAVAIATNADLAKRLQRQGTALRLQQRAVRDYMGALSQLADDDLVDEDKPLGALVDAAVAQDLLTRAQARPLEAVAQLLADAALGLQRAARLQAAIAAGNAPLQQLLTQLDATAAGYAALADTELGRFEDQQTRLLELAAREPAAARLVTLLWPERRTALEARAAAIAKYRSALREIGLAHQALYDARDRLAGAQALRELRGHLKRIEAVQAGLHTGRAG